MGKPTIFTYVVSTKEIAASDALVARVGADIQTEQQLLECLYEQLAFPRYFGFNWNALFDCLRDFHWIDRKKIMIIHEELPKLPAEDLKIYLEILRDAVSDWKPEEVHCLEVVFNDSARTHIANLIATS
jgi:hypothetical protein